RDWSSDVCSSDLRLLQATGALVERDDDERETPRVVDRVMALERMVQYGLDERAATLTLVGGIGGRWARRLNDLGLDDIEDLAAVDPEALAGERGLSAERAREWVEEASRLLRHRPYRWFDEPAGRIQIRA